jgi:circadian clock protein KaiC
MGSAAFQLAIRGGNMENSRVSTNIPGLDDVLRGGFLPASSYLIVGGPGTGKTLMSLQFAAGRAKEGEKVLYMTFSEPEKSIRQNAGAFGWDLTGIEFSDMTAESGATATNGEYRVFPPSEVEGKPLWKLIYQAVEEYKPDCIVIDSATNLKYLSIDEYQYRKQIQGLVNFLAGNNCLSLLLFEPSALDQELSVALAVDGIISLRNTISPGRVIEVRSLEVVKLRGSGYMSGRHAMRIAEDGITVYPHRIEKQPGNDVERVLLPSGIEAFDKMLKGGIHSGTCTLITGPSGTGKSSLGAHFLCRAASDGIRSVIYTFEEGSRSMLKRCRSINIPLEEHVNSGIIVIREINPLELYPDQFLELIRQDVATEDREIALFDSLRGYNLAMEQFGNLIANIQNIVNFTRSAGVTLFLINELEKLTGNLRLSESGVSYLSDNVILLRFAEYNAQVIKIISCLKMRFGNFDPDLRELRISEKGIEVGEKLSRLRGLLTGVPFESREFNSL